MDKFLLKPAAESTECTALKARVSELETQLAAVTAERDNLQVAAKRVPELEAQLAAVTSQRDKLQVAAKSPLPPTAVLTPTTSGGGGGGAAAAAAAAATAPAQLISTAPGATLAELGSDAAFLTPRGRFKLRFCEHAFVLVGKSSECVVPYASVSRVWLLPEASSVGGSLLIAGLSQPAANGKTSVNYVTVHSKPADAALQAEINGTALSGKPALLLRDALTTMRPSDLKVTEPGNPNTGAFKPMGGAAVQCYNKATECSVYLLATELLVREGGKAIVLPYAGMRAEVLPPSGRRTFDIQLECPAPAPAAGSAAAAPGAPPPKPLKLELSLIPADEYSGMCAQLKKKKVNINGSRDEPEEEEDEAHGEGAAEGGGSKSGKARASAAAAADDDEDEDEDDSDDEDDEDFDGGDDSSCDEEYDSADSDDSEANPEFKKPKGSGKKAKPQEEEEAEESAEEEDEEESGEESEEDEEDEEAEGAPAAKRAKKEE